MLMKRTETPAERAERLLPQIDAIFVGGNARLLPSEAAKLIAKGETALRELERFIEDAESAAVSAEERLAVGGLKRLFDSLVTSIALAKEEA